MTLFNVGNIPGPSGLKFLKLVNHVRRDTVASLSIIQEEFGDIVGFGSLANTVIVFDPSIVAEVLDNKNKNYIKGAQTMALASALGNGLATNNDHPSWFRNKMMIAKQLNPKSIQEYGPLMHQCMDKLFQSLESKQIQTFEVRETVSDVMIRITCGSLFGTDLENEQVKKIDDAVYHLGKAIHYHMFSLLPLPYAVPTKKHKNFHKHKQILDDFVYSLILLEKEKVYAENDHQTLLSKIVHAKDTETGEGLSDTEMRDEIITFLIAGYETTSNILNWLIVELARRPKYQELIFKEGTNLNEKVNSAKFKIERPYLFATIAEILRLYPSFPVFSRLNIKDDTLGDYKLPANTNVSIPVWSIQRDNRYWENALEFHPERFLEDPKSIKGNSFLSFGKGERRCVGEGLSYLEIAIITSRLIEKLKFTVAEETNPKPTLEASMKMDTPYYVKYEVRS